MAGLPQNEEANTNKYLYNLPCRQAGGKELQEDFGLDWYDYGARFYDVEVGRFHTVDPVTEKYAGFAPYNYTLNNPVIMTDPDGRWPIWIHNRIIRKAFKGILSKKEIKILIKASYKVDHENGAQLPENSFKHGMRAPNQTPKEARKAADKFIRDSKKIYVKNGDLSVLGEGMHTIMDRTSPSHKKEQVWNGTKGIKNSLKGVVHTLKELNIFRKDEKRVDKAAQQIRAYHESAQKSREQKIKIEQKINKN